MNTQYRKQQKKVRVVVRHSAKPMDLDLKLTLEKFGVLNLFERALKRIDATSDIAKKIEQVNLLMKTMLELKNNHIKHQESYLKFMGLALKTWEEFKQLDKNPPMVPPGGVNRSYIAQRDEWAFKKGRLCTEALTYKYLAPSYEELQREDKDLQTISNFVENLNERVMPLKKLIKDLMEKLKREHPNWNDLKVFGYMKQRWGPLIEKAEKEGLIKFVAKK